MYSNSQDEPQVHKCSLQGQNKSEFKRNCCTRSHSNHCKVPAIGSDFEQQHQMRPSMQKLVEVTSPQQGRRRRRSPRRPRTRPTQKWRFASSPRHRMATVPPAGLKTLAVGDLSHTQKNNSLKKLRPPKSLHTVTPRRMIKADSCQTRISLNQLAQKARQRLECTDQGQGFLWKVFSGENRVLRAANHVLKHIESFT